MNLDRRIVLADDHAIMRAGIRALLGTVPGIRVVAETGDGLEALGLVRSLRPDAILLDVSLPGLNGLEVAAQIARLDLNTRVLMLSMHAGAEYAARALRAGAAGYLVKEAAFEELAAALQAIFVGRRYLSEAIDARLVEGLLGARDEHHTSLDALTPRQRQILQLIAEGFGTRDIAERLHLSVKTVETHRAQLMERLGIHDVPGLVRFAIRMGIVSPDA